MVQNDVIDYDTIQENLKIKEKIYEKLCIL
jgi:hypothetical protein